MRTANPHAQADSVRTEFKVIRRKVGSHNGWHPDKGATMIPVRMRYLLCVTSQLPRTTASAAYLILYDSRTHFQKTAAAARLQASASASGPARRLVRRGAWGCSPCLSWMRWRPLVLLYLHRSTSDDAEPNLASCCSACAAIEFESNATSCITSMLTTAIAKASRQCLASRRKVRCVKLCKASTADSNGKFGEPWRLTHLRAQDSAAACGSFHARPRERHL